MGKRQKLRLLCAEGDREALQPVLDALQARGVSVSEKADTLLAVLSEHFYADETLKTALLEAISAGASGVLPLRIDESELPPEIMTALYARNVIPAAERSAEQTAERIIAALPEKKSRMGAALIAGAAALAVLAGVLIWRAVPKEETKPETAPVMAPEITIPDGLGLRLEDLQYVRNVVIVGDEAHFLTNGTPQPNQSAPSVHDYAVDNDRDSWFSKADGHEYAVTRYDDLGFLALMPRLQSLSFALVDIPALPDLSGTQLRTVEFYDCTIDRLDWFDAEILDYITIDGCPVTDFSPLSASVRMLRADFGFHDDIRPDLSGFHPENLISLTLRGSPREMKMPDLSGCGSLREVQLENLPLEDLDFLRGSNVHELKIETCDRLRDISALSETPGLNVLFINRCGQLRDFSPIGACTELQRVNLIANNLTDASFLEGLDKLKDIRLHGASLPNWNFLKSYADKPYSLSFVFNGSCGDVSALQRVKKFSWLCLLDVRNQSFSAIAPYLKDAQIEHLQIQTSRALDLSLIPPGTQRLALLSCSLVTDLSALPKLSLTEVRLEEMPRLTSLNGVQKLDVFGKNATGELVISDCPRLTDWSAIEDAFLNTLELAGVYTLPDFSRLRFHALKLDSLDWLEDLSCLDALDGSYKSYQSFSLPGMEQIRDLSPIARVIDKSGRLEVPPQLEEQARDLQQQGRIMWYDVVYPEGGWELDKSELSLLSLDELDTLPPALLRRITTVAVAGDTVYDPNVYDVWNRWEGGEMRFYLAERGSGEETRVNMGSIRDLDAFSKLTGLRRLILVCQPIESLDGVQNMESLAELGLRNCPKLTDVSPVFAAQNLERLWLDYTPVSSVQGVQNLYRLNELGLNYTQVSDLSPLTECDFGEAERYGGFDLSLDAVPCGDLSAISAIAHYRKLNVNNLDAALWRETIRSCRIEELECVSAGIDNETLAGLASEHPELRRLCLSWSRELTDLTPLLELDALEEVRVSRDMQAAIDSLNGKEYSFRLNIEG
ncbi:MAG: hypothetical protein Q4E45_03200 [Eubacteriales bacterium]|nr:hypothetical protein [Eubacteriales bacterium]